MSWIELFRIIIQHTEVFGKKLGGNTFEFRPCIEWALL